MFGDQRGAFLPPPASTANTPSECGEATGVLEPPLAVACEGASAKVRAEAGRGVTVAEDDALGVPFRVCVCVWLESPPAVNESCIREPLRWALMSSGS